MYISYMVRLVRYLFTPKEVVNVNRQTLVNYVIKIVKYTLSILLSIDHSIWTILNRQTHTHIKTTTDQEKVPLVVL